MKTEKIKDIYWHSEDYRYRYHEKLYNCPLHIHQHIEIVCVLEGSIELTISNAQYTVNENEAAIIMPWQPHEYTDKKDNKILICVFSEKLLPEFYHLMEANTVENNKYTFGNVTRLLLETLISKKVTSIYTMKAFLYNAIGEFLSTAKFISKNSKPEISDKILDYVLNHIEEDLNLEKIAIALGYSRNYLSHNIKKQFGINFKTLLNCIRIENAKSLLVNTNNTIGEISYLSGFGTERSFNRVFLSLLGITPSQYRNRHA